MSNKTQVQDTQHAFLVAWGWFAGRIGLIQALQGVPLHQKKYIHTPQGKVNVALLIEMGYEVYTKAHSHQVVTFLRRETGPQTAWTRVGANAEMVAWADWALARCPYPLDVGLERFYTGRTLKHSALLHFGSDPVTEDLPAWFKTTTADRASKLASRRASTSSGCIASRCALNRPSTCRSALSSSRPTSSAGLRTG